MAANKPNEGEKKSSKKLILIIALILLLVGGGGAYYFLMYKGGSEQSQDDSGNKAVKNKKDAGKEMEEPELYYELADPLVVNFPKGSSARIIKISLSVLVKDERSVESLKKHEPMIRNNLLMAISSLGADKARTLEGKQELRQMMLTEIGKVLEKMAGKNTAKDVFFTEFVMQ